MSLSALAISVGLGLVGWAFAECLALPVLRWVGLV
jgi:hypothetical protein